MLGSKRNFNFAAQAIAREHQIDGTAELMRNEIADEVAAIAWSHRCRDRRSAKLVPDDRQDCHCRCAGAPPSHRHLPFGLDRVPCFAAFVASSRITLAT